MKDLKNFIIDEAKGCPYCDKAKAAKYPGIILPNNDGDNGDLIIRYADYTEDEKEHFLLQSRTNHIDTSIQIYYCPFCGRKLE